MELARISVINPCDDNNLTPIRRCWWAYDRYSPCSPKGSSSLVMSSQHTNVPLVKTPKSIKGASLKAPTPRPISEKIPCCKSSSSLGGDSERPHSALHYDHLGSVSSYAHSSLKTEVRPARVALRFETVSSVIWESTAPASS
jgi:hypothetical protein